jgi:hypothetical protein
MATSSSGRRPRRVVASTAIVALLLR